MSPLWSLGHPASQCRPGGVMVSEEELQAVEDLAKPFGSPEEMREMARKRLLVQQSVDAAAQAAVTPSGVSLTPPGVASPGAPALGHLESCAPARDPHAATPGTEPKAQTEQPWLSRPIRGRGRLWTHGASPPPPTSSRLCSGAYDALRDDVDDSSVRVGRVRTEHAAAEPRTGAFSLVHAAPVERSEDIQLTPEESARKRAAGIRGPAPVRTGSTLLAAQRAERTQLKRLIDQADRRGAHAIPMEPRPEVEPTHERDLERILGARAVTTPATGNSLAMAVAQAASDSSMDNSDSQFEQLTACVKRGIQNVGLLNLEDQLNHDQRVAALKAVGRGWASMSPKESSHQLKWYLYDYVGTPSDRGATVPDNCWGGSDILRMAATFVWRDVYVIQFHDSGGSKWRCQRYHPTTVTRHGRVVETATAYPLSVLACIDDIQAAKIEQPTLPPLVLRVWGRHYFALTHTEHASSSLSRIDGPAASDPDNPPCGLSPGSDPNPTWPPISPARQRPVDGRVSDSTSPSEYPTTLVVHSQSTTQCTSSAAVESSLVLIPERPMVLAHRSNLLARKRIHATSSGSGEADATASSLVMATAKRGRVGERPHQPHVQPPADRIDEDEWQAVWSALGSEWPSIARTPYPLIYGEVESWLNTAHLDPDILLHHARRFVFLSELLVSLDSQVLVQWTAKWRQDSLLSGLRAYKDKVKDAATEAWIDQWITSAMYRVGLSRLAPLIDSSEDWIRLRAVDYAADDVLRLCDPRRRVRLSQHLLCAVLFDKEIAALHGDGTPTDLIPEKLRRHVRLLRSNSGYRSAYYSPGEKEVDWRTLAHYFPTALVPADPQLLPNTKGSSRVPYVSELRTASLDDVDAYGRLRLLREWATPQDVLSNQHRKRNGDVAYITQNVRGFKKSSRNGWMSAWRGVRKQRRSIAWCIQETHASTDEEADALRVSWARMWGLHLAASAPTLSIADDTRGLIRVWQCQDR